MPGLQELRRRIQMLFHSRRLRADLEEEMRLHVDLRAQQQAGRGLAPPEARTAALRRFGNPVVMRERSQDAWGWTWLESFVRDTFYGIRGLLRSPGVTLVALLSLALGIGANTALFTLINAVMLRSLPVRDPQQLVLLGKGENDGITDTFAETDLYSYPFYRQLQQQNRVFSNVAALCSLTNDVHAFVSDRGEPEPVQVQLVSGTYFQTLGVNPFLGRVLDDNDDSSKGNHPVAVLSYAFWTRSLARDPAVLGRTLRMGSSVFTVVGVAAPEFFGTKVGDSPDAWIPLSMSEAVPPHWNSYEGDDTRSLYILGRMSPGVTAEQASSNVNLIFRQVHEQYLGKMASDHNFSKFTERLKRSHVDITPMALGLSEVRREFSRPLRVLMAIVALVLLIACANIANLLLARSTVRARELAVRQALGAGRARIARQLLTESLVLALFGGALGVAFASAGTRLLLRLVSDGPDTLLLDVSIRPGILLFTLGVTLATAAIFGTVPALRATRLSLTNTLKDGRGSSSGAAKSPLARVLVVSQVALSLVLLVGAGLFLRSLVNLTGVDTGFNKRNVLLFNLDEGSAGYTPEDPRLALLHQQVEERVRALPGILASGYAAFTFSEGSWNGSIWVQGMETHKDSDVKHNIVGNGYFAALQIPLIAGRGFSPQDTATSQRVAIISENTARTLFPAGSPIGRHYGYGGPERAGDMEVIGVARDVKFGSLDEKVDTLDYYPISQHVQYMHDFDVRYTGDRAAISAEVRRAFHDIDPRIPVTDAGTLEEKVSNTVGDQRLVAQLSTFFGLVAAFLSAIGIYGLMSYIVSRRTGEIGIRMALGAERTHVSWLVVRDILVLIAIGIAIGIPATLALGRLVSSMLFGLKPTDPLSLIAAPALLFVVAILAGALPARRATRIDPMIALRCE